MTSPLFFFLFAFLSVCFFLILVQRDFNAWEKFSLLVNPALLALIVLLCSFRMSDVREATRNTAILANELSSLLNEGSLAEKSASAAVVREYLKGEKPLNFPALSEQLQKIRKKKSLQ